MDRPKRIAEAVATALEVRGVYLRGPATQERFGTPLTILRTMPHKPGEDEADQIRDWLRKVGACSAVVVEPG